MNAFKINRKPELPHTEAQPNIYDEADQPDCLVNMAS